MAIKAYSQKDKRRSIKFETDVNIEGDFLYSHAYHLQSDRNYSSTPTNPATGQVGNEQYAIVDFSTVPSGIYNLVVYTDNQVVAKDILILFQRDGINIGDASLMIQIIEPEDGDFFGIDETIDFSVSSSIDFSEVEYQYQEQ